MSSSRILLIANNFPPVRGGSASVYANLARHLRSRLMILAPTRDYADGLKLIGWREHDRACGYAVHRLPLLRTTLTPPPSMPSKWLVRVWDLLIRARVLFLITWAMLLRDVRTVCIGELMSLGWLLPILRRLPGIHTVTYVHGEEITTIAEPADQRRVRRSLLSSDRVVVVSSFTFSAVRTLIGQDNRERLVLIQNGVNTDRFKPGPKPPELLALYGLQDRFVFVSVSRLVQKKGHDNTIRALAQVRTRFPDVHLLIVGSGPFAGRLEEIRDEMGLQEHVTFAGAVSESDLPAHYLVGDVFVMPNRAMPDGDTEGFGLVFLEANSCGLPVIAGKDGGSTEAVDHAYNGLVVDGGRVADIAEAMLVLREHPELRDELRANGLRRAAQSDWAAKAALFETACTAGSAEPPSGMARSLSRPAPP